MAADYFDTATILSKFATNSVTNAVLLDLVLNGAFQNDAATRALFADEIWPAAKITNRTRKFAVQAIGMRNWTDSIDMVRGGGVYKWVFDDAKQESVAGSFYVPEVYVSDMKIRAVVECTTASGNIYSRNSAYWGAIGQTMGNGSDSPLKVATAIVVNQMTEINELACAGIATGNHVTLIHERDATDVLDTLNADSNYYHWIVEYTADS